MNGKMNQNKTTVKIIKTKLLQKENEMKKIAICYCFRIWFVVEFLV